MPEPPPILNIPKKLLSPIGEFLRQQLTRLERRESDLENDDPFQNTGRTLDNAAPDAAAAEQFGHAQVSAIREELERKIIQTKKALARVKIGRYGICESCGQMIDTDRLMIEPEATLCVRCQKKREKR